MLTCPSNVDPLAPHFYMSRLMRKPDFCICKNKDPDQLRGNREADQRLYFCYSDSTIPLLPKSEISSPWPSSVVVQPGLCRTWSETSKTGFLTTWLNYSENWVYRGIHVFLFFALNIDRGTNYDGQWKSVRWFWRRFLKGFYHIWAWWPFGSCGQYHINIFSFPCTCT